MTRPAATRTARRGVARALGGDRHAGSMRAAATDRADENAEYPPWWRYLAWPLIAVAVSTGGMLAGGVPAWRAVAIALAVGAALWAVVLSLAVQPPEWPYDVPMVEHRAPTTWEVAGLAGASESEVSFEQYLRPRLWALAGELLRRRGIDPTSARAVQLVGAREYALLTGADTDPRRVMASVPVLCHTIARLATVPVPDSEPAIRNPTLAGLAGRARGNVQHPLSEGLHR